MKTISLLNSLPWMKPRFITTNPKPKNNQSRGSTHHLWPPKKPRSFFPLASSWPLFSGITYQGVMLIEYLQKGHTVTGQHYSGQLKRLREAIKKGQESSQEESSSTKTMHQLKPLWLQWQQFTIVDLNLSLIHLICRSGPLRLSSFPTNEKGQGWSPFCQR